MAVPGERVLLVGASVRAAVHSAVRAGFCVEAIDLFADADLLACCPNATSIERYPAGFLPPAIESNCDGWMYTGGLENYPRLVERIAQRVPLWGNGGDVLDRVRDPACLADVLDRHGLAYPDWQATPDRLPADGTWLCKGRRSSGGLQVELFRGVRGVGAKRRVYYQRRMPGESCAAVYVAAGGEAVLLGVTRQLVGENGAGGDSFRYTGSIGPLHLAGPLTATLLQLGDVLASEFQLQGLFGVDLMSAGTQIWPVEVNPRLPASVEILERVLSVSAVGVHVTACRAGRLPSVGKPSQDPLAAGTASAGKLVVYAPRTAHVTAGMTQLLLAKNRDFARPGVADIPRAGTTIKRGLPLATVLADGASIDEVERRLGARQRWLEEIIFGNAAEVVESAVD